MADTATKLGEVTKKFKAVNKDVIARLAEYGEVVKSSTSVITDEQAAMVVDILTQDNPFTAEEIEELKVQAIAKKEKAEALAQKEAEEKELQQMVDVFYKQDYRIYIFTGDEMFDEDFISAIDSLPTYSRTAHELEQLKGRSKAIAAAKEQELEQAQVCINEEKEEITDN